MYVRVQPCVQLCIYEYMHLCMYVRTYVTVPVTCIVRTTKQHLLQRPEDSSSLRSMKQGVSERHRCEPRATLRSLKRGVSNRQVERPPIFHIRTPKIEDKKVCHVFAVILGDRTFWETCVPGNARVCGSGEATAIWSFRHCKPAACILGLAGANTRFSLICGLP